MKRILKYIISMFVILLLSGQILGQSTTSDKDKFYQKSKAQDNSFKNLSSVYSPTTLEGELLWESKITDIEIVTKGGVGTTLTIQTYGENFEIIGTYTTVIKYENEYNYIKADIFDQNSLCYRVLTDPSCTLTSVNFYSKNISGKILCNSTVDLKDISLLVDNKVSYAVDSTGCFSFGVDPKTTHTLKVLVSGIVKATYYDIQAQPNGITNLKEISLLFDSQDKHEGSSFGYVMDASTSSYKRNVTINIREGINNRSGNIIKTITSDTEGKFDTGLLEYGYYTGEVVGSSNTIGTYFDFCVEFDKHNIGTIGITPPLKDTQMRIILQGQNGGKTSMFDFDPHIITVPSKDYSYIYAWDTEKCSEFLFGSGGLCDITKNNGTWYVLSQGISYDLDDVSYNLDSMTIDFKNLPTISLEGNAVTYEYYVCLYAGFIFWDNPCVYIYSGDKLIAQYYAPNYLLQKNERLWKVFSLDSTTRDILVE